MTKQSKLPYFIDYLKIFKKDTFQKVIKELKKASEKYSKLTIDNFKDYYFDSDDDIILEEELKLLNKKDIEYYVRFVVNFVSGKNFNHVLEEIYNITEISPSNILDNMIDRAPEEREEVYKDFCSKIYEYPEYLIDDYKGLTFDKYLEFYKVKHRY